MRRVGLVRAVQTPPPHPGTLRVPALSHEGERETEVEPSFREEVVSSHLPLDDGGGRVGVTWCLTMSPNRTAQSRNGMLSSVVALERIGRLDRLVCWQQVEEDGEVVAGAAAEHEQMPDHVAERHSFPAIEGDSTCIEQTTSGQKDQRLVRYLQP